MKPTPQGRMLCLLACLVIGFPNASSALPPAPTLAPQDCGDFLAKISKKPPDLVYDGCVYLPDRQGKPLQATYHVQGRFAARVESYFMKAVRLHALKWACCLWSSGTTQFRSKAGTDFSITMYSGETTFNSRAEWPNIPSFGIVVEALSEEI